MSDVIDCSDQYGLGKIANAPVVPQKLGFASRTALGGDAQPVESAHQHPVYARRRTTPWYTLIEVSKNHRLPDGVPIGQPLKC